MANKQTRILIRELGNWLNTRESPITTIADEMVSEDKVAEAFDLALKALLHPPVQEYDDETD